MSWQVLHHLAAFRRLGFDVWYVEDSDRYVFDPVTYNPTSECKANIEFLASQMDRIGFEERWIFRPPKTAETFGARDLAGLRRLYREADVAFNLCAAQELREEHEEIRRLVLLETDPVASQVAVLMNDEEAIRFLDAYDYLFTYGENLGAPDCSVPLERFEWFFTRPPVSIDWWETRGELPAIHALTTVANWQHDTNDVVFQGETWHWTKDAAFRRLIHLPERSALPLELAVGKIPPKDATDMRRHNWRLRPSIVDVEQYRTFIRSSLGEFTPAKDLYVVPKSGWFSDRSACYLAAGRPVITQDTGFSKTLPTGEGLLGFSSEDEALAAIESVAGNYDRHAAAASEIAREFFGADRLLSDILEKIGLA